ncbi:MAG: PVC-type heme-binding CxxCH protein [Gemmataceae bacterium]
MTPPARLSVAAIAFLLAAGVVATAVPPEQIDGPAVPPTKGSAEEALAQVQIEKGLKVGVWAAEPLMANPVAFAFDERGRAYVAETTRMNNGVPDTRSHMKWLDEDLANRSTADLTAMYTKHNYKGFEKNSDQLRVVWDSTGKGRADKSGIFSGGYNRPQDGLAAGVLARRGSVYFACIPDLYRLKDTKGTNVADLKESLFTGFGPTVQFVGHDLHGLRMGPDGRLYFSIGDRGFVVTTKEGKRLSYPNTGAVLRCEPDGSNLEVVHMGLRNPQELAFDDLGNLFTYDNNSDSGDRARWVAIAEGGDSGWRGGYQYGTLYHPPGTPQGNRGPWNGEKIWHVPGPNGEPPAYVLPPLLHFGNGPAGLTHYPGVGLNDKYRDYFFACDFTSSAGNSVIWGVSVKPKGAGYEVAKHEPFVRGMVPTDCEFGPDGAFYWSDWIGGWSPTGKGRIFRVTDPEAMKNPAVAEARTLLAAGFEKRDTAELLKLLGHPHQQVRTEAGIELGARGGDNAVANGLTAVAASSKDRLSRVHAVWALGIVGRQHSHAVARLTGLSTDADAEIRAQVFRTLGSFPHLPHVLASVLSRGCSDAEPRVRAFAAAAYRRLDRPIAGITPGSEALRLVPLLELLKANADADAYLRHSAVLGLVGQTADSNELARMWTAIRERYEVPAVRLGVVLALRRHRGSELAGFLTDADPKVAAEAARGVYDERVAGALPVLAAQCDTSRPDPIAYRALAANYVLGTPDAVGRVARFAARTTEPDHQRVFALKLLADWASPPRRDPITGLTHDLPRRPAEPVTMALRPVLAGVFAGSDAVRAEATQVTAKLGITEVGPLLTALVRDEKATPVDRADALSALVAVKAVNLPEMTAYALASPVARLRAAGLTAKAKADPAAVLRDVPGLVRDDKTSVAEKQAALTILGKAGESAEGDTLLAELLATATSGKGQPDVLLDALEAAEARAKGKAKLHAPLRQVVSGYRTAAGKSPDKLAQWAETLAGGDAASGRNVFLNNNAVYCQRCHQLDGQGGQVGPPLNGIAAQPGKDRRYLLEAVVLPSAQIAKGYETAVVTLVDGRVVSGVVKEETKERLRLVTPENRELVVPTGDIEARRTGPSAMPDDLHPKLTRRELRDLVEFLSSLRETAPAGGRP